MTKVQLFHAVSLLLCLHPYCLCSAFSVFRSSTITMKEQKWWNKESNRCAIEFAFSFCFFFSIVAHSLRIMLASVLCCQNAQFQFTNRRWNILKSFQIEKNSNKHFSKVRPLVNWTRSFHLKRKFIVRICCFARRKSAFGILFFIVFFMLRVYTSTLAVKLQIHRISSQRVRCDDKRRLRFRIVQRKITHFFR